MRSLEVIRRHAAAGDLLVVRVPRGTVFHVVPQGDLSALCDLVPQTWTTDEQTGGNTCGRCRMALRTAGFDVLRGRVIPAVPS